MPPEAPPDALSWTDLANRTVWTRPYVGGLVASRPFWPEENQDADREANLATIRTRAQAYLDNPTPTQAQSVAAIKALIRITLRRLDGSD